MIIDNLILAIKQKDYSDIKISCDSVYDCADKDELLYGAKLAGNLYQEFHKYCKLVRSEKDNLIPDINRALFIFDRFRLDRCRCEIYTKIHVKSGNEDPKVEIERGFVQNIRGVDPNRYESTACLVECVFCNKEFRVSYGDSGFGQAYSWSPC